jgi:hypothetical protein
MMRLKLSFVLILSMLVLVLSGASRAANGNQSQNPTPSPNKSSKPPQDQPARRAHITKTDQRGTKDAPIVVKVLPADKTKEESEREAKDREDKSSADWWMVKFNGLLVIAAFLQFFWITRQVVWMRRNVEIAKETADAATRAANAAKDANNIARKSIQIAQRTYVKISHKPPGLNLNHSTEDAFYPPPKHRCMVELEIRNIGNTPAIITDFVFTHRIVQKDSPLPDIPPYNLTAEREKITTFLYGADVIYPSVAFDITVEDVVAVQDGSKEFYLLVYVDYIDQFRIHYRAGYARRYNPSSSANNLFIVTKRDYNYDRPRKPGEGNDWNEP